MTKAVFSMRSATVYSRAFCSYCSRAVALLGQKGAQVTVIDATLDAQKREEMIERSGRRTFPQVFIGETHVGGCDELHALEAAGELDVLLRSA